MNYNPSDEELKPICEKIAKDILDTRDFYRKTLEEQLKNHPPNLPRSKSIYAL